MSVRPVVSSRVEAVPLLVEQEQAPVSDPLVLAGDQQVDGDDVSSQGVGAAGRVLVIQQVGGGAVAGDEEPLVDAPRGCLLVEMGLRDHLDQLQGNPQQPVREAEKGHRETAERHTADRSPLDAPGDIDAEIGGRPTARTLGSGRAVAGNPRTNPRLPQPGPIR